MISIPTKLNPLAVKVTVGALVVAASFAISLWAMDYF